MSKKDLQLRWFVVILFLLFIGGCKSSKSIQRRFMWKQVDDTMDGIFDSMASSARAMKNMFGGFIPAMTTAPAPAHTHLHSNIMNYLPTETTKIKYIIHSPTTKPMKVLKMSAPKKVVKYMTMYKPSIIETSKSIKTKYNFETPATLRQMEKEQERIAEGRLPLNHKPSNEIISGQINALGHDWHPILSSTSTEKPYAISHLYTSGLSLDEPLPQPEKQVYDAAAANGIAHGFEEYQQQNTNKYEVTEHTPEESVAVPFMHGFLPMRSLHASKKQQQQQTARSGQSYKKPMPHSPTIKPTKYTSITTSTTTKTTTTTTTDAPNYPASFLQKNRERIAQAAKQIKFSPEINWIRSTDASALEVRSKPTQIIQLPFKSQSWAPTLLPTSLSVSTTTKLRNAEPLVRPTSEERLKPKPTKNMKIERPRDIRQRGSIKFGDKLTEIYK